MALDALLALRDQIASDADLDAFFMGHYGKTAKHLFGYKRSQNANDYPFISYVPTRSRINAVNDNLLASVVIGVNDPNIIDDVMQGHRRLSEAVGLLEVTMNLGSLGNKSIVMPDYDIVYDFGERHPFYEIEVLLKLIWRRK